MRTQPQMTPQNPKQHYWAAPLCVGLGSWIAFIVWSRQPGLNVPPVVGYLVAAAFTAAGVSLFLQAIGFFRAATIPALLAAAALAGIGAWIGFGPGSRRCQGGLGGLAFVPAEWICRLVFGAGAILTGGIILLMARSLFDHRPHPPGRAS
jgi:hypothetical protein